jgi:hypothetical protein
MTHTNTFLNGRQLLDIIVSDERARHQRLIEQGRAPGQSTTKSINKARAARKPGKGNRNIQNRRAIQEQ